jgi:cytochrome bd-type quinol oxidase subunit 2
MLLYLLKVLDGAWPLAVILPLAYFPLRQDARPRVKRGAFLAAFALGVAAGVLYAVFKRNTGWVVREYYDIFILWPLIALCLAYLALIFFSRWKDGPGWAFRIIVPAIAFLVFARTFPDLFIAPLDFDVGMDSIFNMEYLLRATGYATGLFLLFLLFLAIHLLLGRLSPRAALEDSLPRMRWIPKKSSMSKKSPVA